jgi:cysteine-rich repeat protein
MRKSKYVGAAALALAAVAMAASGAGAAQSPAAKCRKALAKAAVGSVKAGLKALDKCHGKRDKGKFTGDCNVVPSAQAKLAAAQQKACGSAPDALALFTGNDATGQIAGTIQSNLAASGSELQGAPTLTGDKAKIKCHAAIGKGRSGIVNAIVKGATACQKRLDKNGTPGPLAADCVVGAGAAGSKASGKITKACGGTSGADVDSCDGLPDCVVTSATTTGQTVARGIFSSAAGGVPECHNGRIDPGETCDPGLFDTDTCVNCQPAGCGDGTTTSPEGCDDGNTTDGDGCSASCTIETPPGGSVVTLVVALTHDPALTGGDVAGVEITVDYDPAKTSIPGSGNVPATEGRVQNLGPDDVVFSVADRDSNTDGQDDQLFIPYGSLGTLSPGDIVRVILDGAPGASISAGDFTCAVPSAVDAQGTPLGGVTCGVTVTVEAGSSTTTTTTTTTTSTT